MADLSDRIANLTPAQRALLQKRLSEKAAPPTTLPEGAVEPIAVVGRACRFAGASDVAAYWRMIRDGVEGISDVPESRWPVDELYDPNGAPGKMNTRRGGFVDRIDEFDPVFFGVTPREAARMDPQQRLLLEVAWEAFEDALWPADRAAGSNTGVFVGIGGADYAKIPSQASNYYEVIDAHMGTGNALSIASNRLSYVFDLRGPSLSVDTACSSSSLAIHLAVESLRSGECAAALAGGVNAILTPETTIAFSKAHMLSPEGRCRPFDAGANGYVRGEGCALVLLKTLSAAKADGDEVLALLRATSANQDGRTSGISAPNGERQKACILDALGEARLSPSDIDYIEAHGTSTPLGDPIEMQALAEVFARNTPDAHPVRVTSVKANIGHTETVSGVAGLIKAIELLRHESIPPQLHLHALNPHIRLDGSRIEVPREAAPWKRGARPRIAGVSSFGFGGTNTHLVVSEPLGAAPSAAAPHERTAHCVKIAAKSEDRVTEQAARYAEHLRDAEASVADIAYSASAGRSDFNHRAVVVAATNEDLVGRLEKFAAGDKAPGVYRGKASGLKPPKTAWLFTGQGAQLPGMGRGLYETEPVYRSIVDRCAAVLEGVLEHSLLDVLYPSGANQDLIHQTRYTQPALLATECALAELWKSWGVAPDLFLGHSIGEYAAAVAGGVMPLESAARLVAERARLMHSAPGHGAMAVLFLPEERVAEAIHGKEDLLSVAAVNGPENTVLSGEATAVETTLADLTEAGVRGQALTVSHGFHSPLMDPILDEFERFAESIAAEAPWRTPSAPIASNLTGQLLEEAPTPRYWRDHLRGAVRFADGVERLQELGVEHWIEAGPAPVLLGMARRCLPKGDQVWLPSLRPGADDGETFAGSLADHYVRGGRVDWRSGDRGRNRHRVELPPYPYARTRCWYEGLETSATAIASAGAGSPLLGARLPVVSANTLYETGLAPESPAYLADHRVQGSIVAPGAMYVEQALSAAALVAPEGPLHVEDVHIQQAMFLNEGERRRVQTTLSPETAGRATLEVFSTTIAVEQNGEAPRWEQHASAVVVHSTEPPQAPPRLDLGVCADRLVDKLTHEQFYELVGARGLEYGPTFRMIDGVERSGYDAVVPIKLDESIRADLRREGAYQLHPVVGDALMQAVACSTPLEADGSYSPHTYMPVRVESIRLYQKMPADEALFAYVSRRSPDRDSDETSPEVVVSDAYLTLADGSQVAALEGVHVQRISQGGGPREATPEDWLYHVAWREAPLDTPADLPTGAWLVFADAQGFADQLIARAEQGGSACVVVRPGDQYTMRVIEQSDLPVRTEVAIDPHDPQHYERLLGMVAATPGSTPAVVAHLWSLDLKAEDGPAQFEAAERVGVGSAMRLLQQAARRSLSAARGVLLVTHGAQTHPAQASLIGLGRVAQMEHPELAVRLVDVDAQSGVERLLEEIAADAVENQVAYRDGLRFVARLESDTAAHAGVKQAKGSAMAVPRTPHQLRIPKPGSFDALRYDPIERVVPGAGQVELEVHATGLNFSDVLKALGLYPGIKDAITPLGIELSGVVTAVGPGVEHLNVGQEAMGVAPYAFGSHTTTADYALVGKPSGLTHDEAATIPITFLTAHHALVRLAHLAKGERVLIHAGAGGVGLAAIQIAQGLGAEVFTTAGSDEKRELLRSLGVEHVMNSRTLDFVEEVRDATGREGIDVVLNSLPGEAIPASLSLLRAYGRFLEIGKIDIYQDRKIGLLPFQDNLSYFAIDLDRVLRERPDYIRGLFAEVMERFESGAYRPLPLTRFNAPETAAAFRYMSQRKNIGKVVVSSGWAETATGERARAEHGAVRSDGGYLVTGGLGALGLQVAEWLVEQGAGGVALLARREPSDEVWSRIKQLRSSGARVEAIRGDVTDAASLSGALRSLPGDFPPLRGVIHAAGVLDDGLLADLTAERLHNVLQPKTLGAWNLHAATLDPGLPFATADQGGVELFVLFSSVAAVLGSPGQANYAAANTSLDALGHLRRAQGLKATTINWGPWAGAGMASGSKEDAVRQKGMDLIDAAPALDLMGALAESGIVQTTVIDARWDAMARLLSGRKTPLLTDVLPADGDSGAISADSALKLRLSALPPEDRRDELETIVRDELARVMAVESEQLDTSQPLSALGLDSLMSLELKNNLEAMLDFTIPMAKLLEGPSVITLAEIASDAIGGSVGDSAEWSPFVTLRAGEGDPLFFLPALGGDALCYREIIGHVGTKRPLLAFRPRGMDDQSPAHAVREELVRDYIAAIRARQPEGPYRLAGWSTGGITGFAVAEQFEAEGERVALLALFDTPLPSVYDAIDPDDEVSFLVTIVDFAAHFSGLDFSVTAEQLASIPSEQRFRAILDEAIRGGMFPADVQEEYVHRMVEVGEALVRASRGYEPKPIDADLHFFSPQVAGALSRILGRETKNESGWRDTIGQRLTHHEAAGDHFTMMTGEGAAAIARVLDSLL